MTGIEDREEAFERKYAHDQEIAFKIEARACHMLGHWAAEKMALKGAPAETYAKKIVSVHLEQAGFDNVKSKVMKDFADKDVKISGHVFDRELEKCLAEAKSHVMKPAK